MKSISQKKEKREVYLIEEREKEVYLTSEKEKKSIYNF